MKYTAKQREEIIVRVAQGVDLHDDNVIFNISLRQADIMCQTTGEFKGKATWIHNDGYTRILVTSKYGNGWKATVVNNEDFAESAETGWIDLVDKLERDF